MDHWILGLLYYVFGHMKKSLFSSHDSEDISCMRKGSLGKQHLFLGVCGFQPESPESSLETAMSLCRHWVGYRFTWR